MRTPAACSGHLGWCNPNRLRRSQASVSGAHRPLPSMVIAGCDLYVLMSEPHSAELPAAILEIVNRAAILEIVNRAVGLSYRRYIRTALFPAVSRVRLSVVSFLAAHSVPAVFLQAAVAIFALQCTVLCVFCALPVCCMRSLQCL